jgi:hypothetical protein
VAKGIDAFGPATEKLLNGGNIGRLIDETTGDHQSSFRGVALITQVILPFLDMVQ